VDHAPGLHGLGDHQSGAARQHGPQLDGPFDVFWSFGCYLLPLAVAELYFRAARGGKGLRLAATIVLTVGTGLTLLGVFGAWRVMWGPYV
jgi:hypothetical protein